jgi:hypothetical protein
VHESDARFVFSDGHGIARITEWFDNLDDLDKVDWEMIYQKYWQDHTEDMDRQRRKQAEFLVHRLCDWALIQEIGVIDQGMKRRVEEILQEFPQELQREIRVRRGRYYS